ncbi:hypothetical protein TWF106_009653 [Orbilia oligospora]|uniref:VIT domain-containing protein n=1 Tax=Orbilia oligospora TaxID=2813651 RepID=A0A6G1MCL4_ORBOL|nr:hypothetical protein TWF788_006139 [Orbilia oligospora]KAF3213076.1 hypothetical protein TWF106_009653 [Orbilia oligospora]KAF3218961.1 hypothetical protein TWF679_000372 [Orbilia oligospora]KAF3251394.1 hypothetical protein TWF192_004890 [Orbilia oligospora]
MSGAYVGRPDREKRGVYCHEHWETIGYPLLSSSYAYKIQDIYVQATLTETYEAQTNVKREVSYIFEVPPEAAVTDFSAQVGDRHVKAIVEEKAKADEKYQKAKSAGAEAWKLDKINDEGNLNPYTPSDESN